MDPMGWEFAGNLLGMTWHSRQGTGLGSRQVWCEWIEMELRHKEYDEALKALRRAVPGRGEGRPGGWNGEGCRDEQWLYIYYIIILYICCIDIIYISRVIIYIYIIYIYIMCMWIYTHIYISEWYEHIYMFLWWWMIIDDYMCIQQSWTWKMSRSQDESHIFWGRSVDHCGVTLNHSAVSGLRNGRQNWFTTRLFLLFFKDNLGSQLLGALTSW